MADALDQSWGRIDPQRAAAAGVKLVMGYLSNDSSKNWNPQLVKAYLAAGVGCGFNWEDTPGNPFRGASQGQTDAIEACRQLKQIISGVGTTPPTQLSIIFSVDSDVDMSNSAVVAEIVSYFAAARAICHQNGFLIGVYGKADLIEFLHGHGLTDVEWQTLAWSRGRLSPEADLYQGSINNTLANTSVDLDTIEHSQSIGAWWPDGEAPSGSGVPIPPDQPPTTPVRDGMYEVLRNTTTGAVRAAGPNFWRPLEGKTKAATAANITNALSGPLAESKTVRDVSPAGMDWWKAFYVGTAK